MYSCPRCLGYKQAISQEGPKWEWITCPLCNGRGELTDEEATAVYRIVNEVNAFALKAEKKIPGGLNRIGRSLDAK